VPDHDIMGMNHPHSPERVLDQGDHRWTVREVKADTVPGSSAPRCLICESDDIVRRIWRYPENWLGLSDDELLQICDKSAP
jgi:hypothetical protein